MSADNLIECVKKKDHQKVRASFEYIKHINTTTSLFHFLGFSYFGVDFWHRFFLMVFKHIHLLFELVARMLCFDSDLICKRAILVI